MDQLVKLSEEDRNLLHELTAELKELRAEVRSMNGYSERNKPDELLTCGEAAIMCGVRRQTISRWIREKRLKKVYQGGKCGILKADLIKCKPEKFCNE